MRYSIGIDIGGTFTDCVVSDDTGIVASGKSPSTPGNLSQGFFGALTVVADKLGLTLADLLSQTQSISHASTVGTNAMIQQQGARTGLLVTAGTEDTLVIMRGHSRLVGAPVESYTRLSQQYTPPPIVPRQLTRGIHERIDSLGTVVAPLNEQQLASATRELVEEGIDALAICFLWSFVNPIHELRAGELVARLFPHLYVSVSNEIMPRWGEYERMAVTAINCRIGPIVKEYLDAIGHDLGDRGYRGNFFCMECAGGVMTKEEAGIRSFLTIDSGPAAGGVASIALARALSLPNVLCTDVGGTSFDVGLIVDGVLEMTENTELGQYEYFVPKVNISSIGQGGGSIVRLDEATTTVRVGPDSAGAVPGPICYATGGTKPTLTDADAVLGFLDPDYFLDGRMKLDREAAVAGFRPIADAISKSTDEVAAGVCQIVEVRMAELVRRMLRGKDPRDFVVFAYGGSGPVHAAGYARELGCTKVIVPQGELGSVWSALGTVVSDVLRLESLGELQIAPFDANRVTLRFDQLESRVKSDLVGQGLEAERIQMRRYMGIRYKLQIHELRVPIPSKVYDDHDMEEIVAEFERIYEETYGKGTGYRAAGIELVSVAVEGRVAVYQGSFTTLRKDQGVSSEPKVEERSVYWKELGRRIETAIYRAQSLAKGSNVAGPAILEFPDTTVIVLPEQRAAIDSFGNVVLTEE